MLAALSGLVQLGLFLGGVKLKTAGVHAAAGQTIVFAVLMLVCAGGMWFMRYWAVLGFMALLAILVVLAAVALIKVSTVLGAVVALVIVGGGGFLFWKLVRVLSRIQMPKYPGCELTTGPYPLAAARLGWKPMAEGCLRLHRDRLGPRRVRRRDPRRAAGDEDRGGRA